jgi:O-acetyl-ADP-ribose deacetylase (regulator of RNase III)
MFMISGKIAIIAVKEVKTVLENHSLLEKVIFMCFNRQSYDCYKAAIQEVLLWQDNG